MTRPHGQDKLRSRDNRARVRAILRDHWDPIGLSGFPPEEYHAYADKAYVMLMYDNASADQIAGYLEWVAADYMGLSAGSADSDRAAQMIFALRREFQTPTQ
jgi:hypothetical protein